MQAKSLLKIGNASGFWGDRVDASYELATQQPDLDYITLDYLAEVSLSIMAIQQQKDKSLGYAKDFIEVIKSLIPLWKKGSKIKIVTNAGGLNPRGCAEACKSILNETDLKIGIVTGDDVLAKMKEEPDRDCFNHLDSHKPLKEVFSSLRTANAYLGARSIRDALIQGADIVITGRVTDPSLTVGPCMAHFGWKWEDYDKIASATIAGHLIECSTQVTGGISTQWLNIPDPAHIGYPFIEMDQEGTFVITKPEGTSGMVTIETVKEQLLYEIGDPGNFLGPDVTTSFLSLKLENQGTNRIKVSGAKGSPPTKMYKVSATYFAGYKAEGMLGIFGRDAEIKARRCGEIILQRLHDAGYDYEQSLIECLGSHGIVPGIFPGSVDAKEGLLRISVADKQEKAVERFAKEIAPLVTSGPQGTTGYTSGRPHVRPIFGYWPCLIPKDDIVPRMERI